MHGALSTQSISVSMLVVTCPCRHLSSGRNQPLWHGEERILGHCPLVLLVVSVAAALCEIVVSRRLQHNLLGSSFCHHHHLGSFCGHKPSTILLCSYHDDQSIMIDCTSSSSSRPETTRIIISMIMLRQQDSCC